MVKRAGTCFKKHQEKDRINWLLFPRSEVKTSGLWTPGSLETVIIRRIPCIYFDRDTLRPRLRVSIGILLTYGARPVVRSNLVLVFLIWPYFHRACCPGLKSGIRRDQGPGKLWIMFEIYWGWNETKHSWVSFELVVQNLSISLRNCSFSDWNRWKQALYQILNSKLC